MAQPNECVARPAPHPAGHRAGDRRDGDYRPDCAVKREIHAELADRYHIRAAIDDNPNVVQLWEELGIPVTVVPGWPG